MENKSELKIRDRKIRRREERLAAKQKKAKKQKIRNDDFEYEKAGESFTAKSISSTKKYDGRNLQVNTTKMKDEPIVLKSIKSAKIDSYSRMDPYVAAAIRKDDEEIAELEAKLFGGKKESKSRLHKEYAKLEGYGDDFGDFLDDLDLVVKRVVGGDKDGTSAESYKTLLHNDDTDSEEDENDNSSGTSSDVEEEMIPMKEPVLDDDIEDDDDSVTADLELREAEENDYGHKMNEKGSNRNCASDSENTDDESDDENSEPHVDSHDLYRPSDGEDIYGNKVASTDGGDTATKKYTPPHLRKKEVTVKDDQASQETHLAIQRSLNSALNRLSDDSVVPVAQAVAKIYASYPKTDVNICVWKNTRNACISRSHQMTSLIPVYVCALAGVHLQKGDTAQLGEFLMEKVIVDLMAELKIAREENLLNNDNDELITSKEASNLLLVLCYLYNFEVVHCTLLYDLIRNLIKSFKEIDVEMLLLILSHCGRALRSDDPSALKEIVILVQKSSLDEIAVKASSSRIDFMVNAIMDLKNNKRKKTDESFAERTSKLRRALGQIKATTAATFHNHSMESTARITLDDVLNAETKGRWWKIGASWMGNQYSYQDEKGREDSVNNSRGPSMGGVDARNNQENEALLKLAAKLRMNTDLRRSIFCIIMGSTDYEDCFEKLVRAGMLKNRTERDTVRVLMECCGHEKAYNKYYSHLAARICEFQMQCKFTFQLAFWDVFKQFDEITARKVANLAKLLFNLVVTHNCLKMHVVKTIDMSSPRDLSENAIIFLTIFFSSIMEHCSDNSDIQRIFFVGRSQEKTGEIDIFKDVGNDDMGHMDDAEALRANITVFLLQVLKASPKYKKGSKFRANLKAAIKCCDPDDFA